MYYACMYRSVNHRPPASAPKSDPSASFAFVPRPILALRPALYDVLQSMSYILFEQKLHDHSFQIEVCVQPLRQPETS